MAQPGSLPSEQPSSHKVKQKFFKLFSRSNQDELAPPIEDLGHKTGKRAQSVADSPAACMDDEVSNQPSVRPVRGRVSRSVVPELPRAQTFKRQLSEERSRLAPIKPTPGERRAVSVDRRSHGLGAKTRSDVDQKPDIPCTIDAENEDPETQGAGQPPPDKRELGDSHAHDDLMATGGLFASHLDVHDFEDHRSESSSYYDEWDETIRGELESTWILNLSMRFKDRSNREKFFVTYRQNEYTWRRVTVTVDYRDAPESSLEMVLRHIRQQREKNLKIYEAIRQSLPEIQFFDTVTNLKLETADDRLHVHVVEDANEIIQYPHTDHVAYLGCRCVKEQDLEFIHHMSGFVYKVRVGNEVLIKKEIPGPETIDPFLYEINALHSLRHSDHVIRFYGLVVDDYNQVKGLLINYADGGALIDKIYDDCKERDLGIEWSQKERWAQQIVHGLADVHESGFVQGDFTLSNIVLDEHDDAKIIDINRRGCPVGWEPPEATPLIETRQQISMYIGVKSDLYQLGMVLWAIAMEEDEPEREGRPLALGSEDHVPEWYRQITDICLNPDPRKRLQAALLLQLFPPQAHRDPQFFVGEGYDAEGLENHEHHAAGHPRIQINNLPRKFWSPERSHSPKALEDHRSWQYAPRGRSPPSPMPSNLDERPEYPGRSHGPSSWAANRAIRASYSDAGGDEVRLHEVTQQLTPSASAEIGPLLAACDIEGAGGSDTGDYVTLATSRNPYKQELPNEISATPTPQAAQGADLSVCEDAHLDSGTEDATRKHLSNGNELDVSHHTTGGSRMSIAEDLADHGDTQPSLDAHESHYTLSEATGASQIPPNKSGTLPAPSRQVRAHESSSSETTEATESSETGEPAAHQQTVLSTPADVPRAAGASTYDTTPRISPSGSQNPLQSNTFAGIGASHGDIDNDLIRSKKIYDDDFDIVDTSDKAPAFAVTKDTKI